jgi:tetratricopeptide (TPR) repeat protein
MRKPADPQAQAAFQGALQEVLNNDPALEAQFSAVFNPLSEPAWLLGEPEQPTLPTVAEELPVQPGAAQETPIPATPDVADQLSRRLREDAELLRIVYALAYDNPSLFSLAGKLAPQPDQAGRLDNLLADAGLWAALQELLTAEELEAVRERLREDDPFYRSALTALANDKFLVQLITTLASNDVRFNNLGRALRQKDSLMFYLLLANDAPLEANLRQVSESDALRAILPRLNKPDDLGDLVTQLGSSVELKDLAARLVLETEGDDFPDQVRQIAAGGELAQALRILSAHPELAQRLSAEQPQFQTLALKLVADDAQPIVNKMAQDALYGLVEKLAVCDRLVERLVDDESTFFSSVDALAKSAEMDSFRDQMLVNLLTILDNQARRWLSDERAAHLIADLAERPNVQNLAQRILGDAEGEGLATKLNQGAFYDLVKAFGADPGSEALARQIIGTVGFPEVAAELSQDAGLTNLVKLMQTDEKFIPVARMLRSGGTSAQAILAVANKPEVESTVSRMCAAEHDQSGFNDLVKKLREEETFLGLCNQLKEDELLAGLNNDVREGKLTAKNMARRLTAYGDRLHAQHQEHEAIEAYHMAMLLDSNFTGAIRGHAQACHAIGNSTRVIEDYQTLIARDNQDTASYLKLGQVYLSRNMIEEAKENFHKVIDISTDPEELRQATDGFAEIGRR